MKNNKEDIERMALIPSSFPLLPLLPTSPLFLTLFATSVISIPILV